jgi:hypothetical protein
VALTEAVWESTTDPAVALAVVSRFFVVRAAGQRPLTELAVALRRPATRNVLSRHRKSLQSIYAMFVADRRAAIAEALKRAKDESVERGTHTATQAEANMEENELVRASMTVADMWRLLQDDTGVIGSGNAADQVPEGSSLGKRLRTGSMSAQAMATLSPVQFIWMVAKIKAAGIAAEDSSTGAAAVDEAASVAILALRNLPAFDGAAAAMLGDAAAAASAREAQTGKPSRPGAKPALDAGARPSTTGSFRRTPSSLTLVSDAAASLSTGKAAGSSASGSAAGSAARSGDSGPSSKVVARTISAARRVAVALAQAVMSGGPHEDAAAVVQSRRLHGAPEWHTDAELEGQADWAGFGLVGRPGSAGSASGTTLRRSASGRAGRSRSGGRSGGSGSAKGGSAADSSALRPENLPSLPPTASAALLKLVLPKDERAALKQVTRSHLEKTGQVREGLIVELKRAQRMLRPFPDLAPVLREGPTSAAYGSASAAAATGTGAGASRQRGPPSRTGSGSGAAMRRVGSGRQLRSSSPGRASAAHGTVGTAMTATGHIVPPAAVVILQFAGCLGTPDALGLGTAPAKGKASQAPAGPVPQPPESELVPAVANAMSVEPDTDISFTEFVMMLGAVASALAPDPYEDVALKLEAFISERILPGFHVAVTL